MAINPFVQHFGEDTPEKFYGVKIYYRAATDEYLTEDGRVIPADEIRQLRSGMSDRFLKELSEDQQKAAIKEANEIILREWNKRFNAAVLKYLRICVEHGAVSFNTMPIEYSVEFDLNANPSEKVKYKTVTVCYAYHLPDMEAYRIAREQIEDAVREAMKPPKFRK